MWNNARKKVICVYYNCIVCKKCMARIKKKEGRIYIVHALYGATILYIFIVLWCRS